MKKNKPKKTATAAGLYPLGRAQHVSIGSYPLGRALHVSTGSYPLGRALHVSTGSYPLGRALHVSIESYPLVRATMKLKVAQKSATEPCEISENNRNSKNVHVHKTNEKSLKIVVL